MKMTAGQTGCFKSVTFLKNFWPYCVACGILPGIPWPGIEPAPPTVEAQSLNHWTTREVPVAFLLEHISEFLASLISILSLHVRASINKNMLLGCPCPLLLSEACQHLGPSEGSLGPSGGACASSGPVAVLTGTSELLFSSESLSIKP